MKFLCEIEPVPLGEDIVYVPVGENAKSIQGVIKVNNEGAEILELLKKYDSAEECINILAKKYENDKRELESYLLEMLSNLTELGILKES